MWKPTWPKPQSVLLKSMEMISDRQSFQDWINQNLQRIGAEAIRLQHEALEKFEDEREVIEPALFQQVYQEARTLK